MKFAVVRFPGSNCDQDAYHGVQDVLGADVDYVWHQDTSLGKADVVILPGGFSYGDYLRTGAVAQFSPIMDSVKRHAANGGLVIGICNGFQVLCESGLLPGALVRNQDCRFICKQVRLRVENATAPLTRSLTVGDVLRIPIAHGEGCYVADDETLDQLESEGRVMFRYCEADGTTTASSNPNGSMRNIAGIANEGFNVVGMMPHPERAISKLLGSADGAGLLLSLAHRQVSRITY
jgi:phosphoribosylformylglycinamidine synthase